MPVLRVHTEDGEREILFTPGNSLRDILAAGCIQVRSGCGGVGSCGLCLVRIEAGAVNDRTEQELSRLRPEELRAGVRFACQVKPLEDIRVTILHPPPHSLWRPLSRDDLARFHPPLEARRATGKKTPFGVAVDLGTTHIRLTLWDMGNGVRLAGRSGLNPQASSGSDVMTRLTAACASPERAREIAMQAREAIGEALSDIANKEGCCPAKIGRIVIVGNSAMLTLLAERNYELLLKPAYWTSVIDCRPEETSSWCASWGLKPALEVELVQPLAGFVGSDLLACVLATRLIHGPAGALLIDFGTNSEIALWDGKTIRVTSAAGGPAFEGCGVSCGMPAEPGAVFRVEQHPHPPGFSCEVIGGGEALGICGSGLVDIIAILRKAGKLNSAGRVVRGAGNDSEVFMAGREELILKKRDIDAFQRAKAAIGAGTKCLMEMAGIGMEDLRRVCVCGAFGRFLNVPNAQAIGLLPGIAADKVELCGNSALAGCEFLLFSMESGNSLEEVRNKTQIVNLAQAPEFEELFVENLYLRPLRLGM